MRVDRTIAALRADRSVLQRAQSSAGSAAQGWREDTSIAPLLAELEQYGGGVRLGACPGLAALFEPGPRAGAFVELFCQMQAAAMKQARFLQIAFRHNFDGRASTLLLARAGTAQLTLVAFEPGSYEATSAAFSDAARLEAVIAGRAAATRLSRGEDGDFTRERLELRPGARLKFDLSQEALCIHRVETRLVSLRLYRSNPDPAPTREYDLASVKLLHQASGEVRASRHEAMMALLGRMRRAEAAPTMAAMACEGGPEGLRWQALRELLALDTAEGFQALCAVAGTAGDPLGMPAGALRAQLVEAHPELLSFEAISCRV